jgi:hypothetical protein
MAIGIRVGLVGALAIFLAACGAGQPAQGAVTFQVVSDSGPLAHSDTVFAATSLARVEAQVASSPTTEKGDAQYQWKIRAMPPKSLYIALIIGPQAKGAAGALACVETTLTGAQFTGHTLTFVETTRVVGPAGPCRTTRADNHYSLVAVPMDALGSGSITVVVTHQPDGVAAMTLALPADSQTSLQLS